MQKMAGILPALLTLYNENGSVDLGAISALVDFLVTHGVNGLYVCGTTGEFALLDEEERRKIAETVVSAVRGRVTVYVHVGDIHPERAASLAAHAESIGADGVGAACPYYFAYSEAEILQYYSQVAEAVSKQFPVYLYNIPSRTTNHVQAEWIRGLVERHPNIVGLKDSTGNMGTVSEFLLASRGLDFGVVQGADELLLPGLALGCAGSVSGNANVFPEIFVGLWRAFKSGDLEAARRAQTKASLISQAFGYGNIPLIKEGLRQRGIGNGLCRLPFLPVSAEAKQRISEILNSEIARL